MRGLSEKLENFTKWEMSGMRRQASHADILQVNGDYDKGRKTIAKWEKQAKP